MNYWIPTRPYSIIGAINRVAAATGSMMYAQLAAHADYNGHRVVLDFRRHAVGGARWVTEYFWAQREVLARGLGRGGFEVCLAAGIMDHERGALGSTFIVRLEEGIDGFSTEEQATICEARGLVPYTSEIEAAHNATWRDARFAEVNGAMRYESQFGCPAVGFLANSATLEEYEAKVEAFFAERKARRRAPAA